MKIYNMTIRGIVETTNRKLSEELGPQYFTKEERYGMPSADDLTSAENSMFSLINDFKLGFTSTQGFLAV